MGDLSARDALLIRYLRELLECAVDLVLGIEHQAHRRQHEQQIRGVKVEHLRPLLQCRSAARGPLTLPDVTKSEGPIQASVRPRLRVVALWNVWQPVPTIACTDHAIVSPIRAAY